MIDSLSRVRQTFPDHVVEATYQAYLPVYNMRVVVKGLLPHALSRLAQHMLRAVNLGFVQVPAIAYLLGLEEIDLARAGAELLDSGLLEQSALAIGDRRDLSITPLGKRHLTENLELMVPEKRTYTIHYSALSKTLMPQQMHTRSVPEARQDGDFVLPTDGMAPAVVDLHIEDVRQVLREANQPDFEVTAVIQVQRCYLEYVPGIRAFILRDKRAGEQRIELFRGFNHLKTESAVLLQLRAANYAISPDDVQPAEPEPLDLSHLVSKGAAQALTAGMKADGDIFTSKQELETVREILRSTQDTAEIDGLKERIQLLERQLTQAEHAKEQVSAFFEKHKKDYSPEIVPTEAHRDLLKKALREAQERVTIIAPWMNRRTVDREMISLLRDCLRRGVTLQIGWGYPNSSPQESDRQRSVVDLIKRDLRAGLAQHEASRLVVTEIGYTHEKILICDKSYGIVTSFNWLSYRGEDDEQFRRETGVLLRLPQAVQALTERARQAFVAPRSRPA